MCGINGITRANQFDRIEKMMSYTYRRGPDGKDVYSNNDIMLFESATYQIVDCEMIWGVLILWR